jgi:glucose-fructose oxidoreductase
MAGVYRRSDRVRYAVVGLGHIAQSAVLPAFAHAQNNSSLHALISADREKLAALGRKHDVPVRGTYDEYEACLRDIDAVYLCVPNSMHAEFAIRAANVGVHVLCEKPLGVTRGQCERIIRKCRDAGVKVMTAYRLHFERVTLTVLELLRRGDIGELRYFTSAFSMIPKPGLRTMPELGGGTLFNLGVYCINAARMVFDAEPTQVFAYSVPGDEAGMPGIDETTAAVLHFDGGRVATFVTSFAASDVSGFRVVGTKGDVLVQPAFEYTEPLGYQLTIDGSTTRHRGRKTDQFAPEIIYFSDCILTGREPESSAEEGAQDIRVIQALYESASRGEPIALPLYEEPERPTITQVMSRPPVRPTRLIHSERTHH